MLVAERLLCTLGQYDGEDGGTRLLRRWWGRTSKKSFFIVLLVALRAVMMKITEMFPSVPCGGIQITVVTLTPTIPPTINMR